MAYPYRTTEELVRGVLGPDYDCVNAPSLVPRIRAANLVVTRVAACATAKGRPLTTAELTELEGAMAAHFYTLSDPTYTSKSTGGASGSFARDPKTPQPYKELALALDPSGCLAGILSGQRAGGAWLGKRVSEQLPYDERN